MATPGRAPEPAFAPSTKVAPAAQSISPSEPVSLAKHRRGIPITYARRQRRNQEMLSRALNLGTTVAFIGAGCSVDVGLPSWERFAVEAIKKAAQVLPLAEQVEDERREEFQQQLMKFGQVLGIRTRSLKNVLHREPGTQPTRRRPVSGDQMRFILGYCKRFLDWVDSRAPYGKPHSFHELLKDTFDRRISDRKFTATEVHEGLWHLPIHRFITSNYDLVLEKFIAKKLGFEFDEFDQSKLDKFNKFKREKAFTQQVCYSEQLARFAIGGTEDSRHMIFHCHGWCEDPESMILTEEDYQHWYLSEMSGAGPSFRQTMELLFGSHPILFVGFSLRDPDLLITLRTLSAVEPERKPQRQLFALLQEKEAKDEDQMDRLFDQFGVNVIGFAAEQKQELGPALAAELKAVKERLEQDRDRWLQKPRLRVLEEPAFENRTPMPDAVPIDKNAYWHYQFADIKAGKGQQAKLKQIRRGVQLGASNDVENIDAVVDHTIACRNMVEVCANDDGVPRTAWQRTYDIGELRSFYALF